MKNEVITMNGNIFLAENMFIGKIYVNNFSTKRKDKMRAVDRIISEHIQCS